MDTGTGMRAIPTSCVQYIYDNNGSNIPNKIGSDLIHSDPLVIGLIMPDGTFEIPIGEYKTYYFPPAKSINTCDIKNQNGGGGDSSCTCNYWAVAKRACLDNGFKMATAQEISEVFSRRSGDTKLNQTISKKGSSSYNYWISDANVYAPDVVSYYNAGFGNYSSGSVCSSHGIICLGK